MADINIEQALLDHHGQCLALSPKFVNVWMTEAQRMVAAFGIPPVGTRCPRAVFAQPMGADQVAVVQVSDRRDDPGAPPVEGLWFHFLVFNRTAYERCLGDPFLLARRLPSPWQATSLPTLQLPMAPPPQRTVAEARKILQRVKANALKEGEDPEAAPELTPDNAESPALLGGVQILVDGGKLVFERPDPDPALVEGLWTLLPQTTRARLWPTSFAFSNELGFDVVVMPRVPLPFEEGYTLEEKAAEYPEGRYELALQTAAEAGDQAELDGLFQRRSSNDTLRMAVILLIIVAVAVLLIPRDDPPEAPLLPRERIERAAVAAGAVAVADPWTAIFMIDKGNQEFRKNK